MNRKHIALFLLAAMLATTACGGDTPDKPDNSDTTPANGNDTTPVVEGYDYQGKDFNDYEFAMLNLDTQYGSYIRFDFEEQTGEQLDDAVYDRNRYVEDQLNISLSEVILARGSEWQTGQAAICEALMQQVMADDDDYDAAYLPVIYKRDILADIYILNLADIPQLHIYEEYWDAAINESLTVNDNLFVASGPLNMMTLDTAWVMLFNQDLMDDLKMEYPYQLVRDGKWTIDKMGEYAAACANLNGDASFKFTEGGNAVYGILSHSSAPAKLLFSAGVDFYDIDKNGDIVLNLGDEKIFSTLEKLNSAMDIMSGKGYFNNGDINTVDGYVGAFNLERGVFLAAQLKESTVLRSMEATFGLLPYPKFDESQENYRVAIGTGSEYLGIPTTQDDPSRAGFILDALTYESHKDVLPVFYDVTLSQKGLRNDESIEMLEIVWNTRSISLLDFYGIDKLAGNLGNLISGGTGTGTASSIIATNEPTMIQLLDDFLASLE